MTVNSKLPRRENESWNDMKNIFHDVTGSFNSKRAHPSSPGICGAFVIFFLEPLQLPYGRGRGFIQRPHGGAEISVQMPHPGTTLKLHFFVICGWGLKFCNVMLFYLKKVFTLNVCYSREMLCLNWMDRLFHIKEEWVGQVRQTAQ